jgi:HAD superfamily hydrolase (TIGR01509 family)
MPVQAVIFDLDGVLLESEGLWNRAKRELVEAHGVAWPPDAERTMMGMSSREWSAYLREVGVPLDPAAINDAVVERMAALYDEELPLLPGAVEAVRRLADRWPLGLASSSNRPIIELVLERAGLAACFAVTVSSEEVARGKPAPDVYEAAAERLGAPAAACVAIEDSTNGLRSALAAEMGVIAVPNREFPPDLAVVSEAGAVLGSLEELTVEVVERVRQDAPVPLRQYSLELILARNLIDALAIPGFLVGREAELLFFNEAAGELLGQRFEETGSLERDRWRHIGPLDADGNPVDDDRLPIGVALREGRPATGRFHIRTDQHRLVEIETSALPLVTGERHRGAIVVFWPVDGGERPG